jgi:hypothetical protein
MRKTLLLENHSTIKTRITDITQTQKYLDQLKQKISANESYVDEIKEKMLKSISVFFWGILVNFVYKNATPNLTKAYVSIKISRYRYAPPPSRNLFTKLGC